MSKALYPPTSEELYCRACWEKQKQETEAARNQRDELIAALRNLIAECQDSRRFIVLEHNDGFAAYQRTAEAMNEARKAIAQAEGRAE